MRITLINVILALSINCFGCDGRTSFCKKDLVLTEKKINTFADTVYRIEGGKKAKKPYGILTIPVKDEQSARKVCINTIKNNYKRWNAAGRTNCFIDFFANRWCPSSSDYVGNKNWKVNAHKILK
jgi:hypothetical protein